MNAVDGAKVLTDLRSEYLRGDLHRDEYEAYDDATRAAMRIHAAAVLQELYGVVATASVTPELLELQGAVQRLDAKLAEKAGVK